MRANVSQQDSITEDGVYKVAGTDSSSPVTDDGILIHFDGYQVKIGVTNAKFAVRHYTSSAWDISQ